MKLFNKIFPIVVISFYIAVTSQNTLAYLYFEIEQSYIAKNLCVQKDIEDNLCMGNCYLKALQKRISDNENQKSNKTTPFKYNSSNPIQEYVSSIVYRFCKIESVSIFKNNKVYQLLIEDYAPPIPPPQLVKIS